MSTTELIRQWEIASADLELDIITPFDLILPKDVTIHAPVLLKEFGAKNGTLIVTDHSQVKTYDSAIAELGFGFSVLSEPRGRAEESYDRAIMIEMLSEWGWFGAASRRPGWIKDVEKDET